jgi:hypothetical protein
LQVGKLLSAALSSGLYSRSALVQWAALTEARVRRTAGDHFFSQISRLSRLDVGSPVLQNREGYREVLRSFLALRAGLSIQWPEVTEAVFGETRDVAKLYEVWCLLEIRRALGQLGAELPLHEFECKNGRLRLLRGSYSEAKGPIELGGRSYRLQLHYNKMFSPADPLPQQRRVFHANSTGTWSKVMKPDYTIILHPAHMTAADAAQKGEQCILHLDAKYRLKNLKSMLADGDVSRTYVPDDIDKMHAYAAGINGTSGAYVLYPGDDARYFLRNDRNMSVGALPASPGRRDEFIESFSDLLNLAVAPEHSNA